jgi:ribosomal protein S18 acetylase RimI-like enzyme
VGAQLLKAVEDEARCHQMGWICLNVAKDNLRAQKLYARYGYSVVAEEPGTWSYEDEYGELHQVHEPAWRMEKDLTQGS